MNPRYLDTPRSRFVQRLAAHGFLLAAYPQLRSMIGAIGATAVILLLSLLTTWAVAHISAESTRPGANLNVSLRLFGITIRISAGGIVGIFLAVAIISFFAVYVLARTN
jgi:hypothetical protein